MLVESQNKFRIDQKSKKIYEVVKHRKHCKSRRIRVPKVPFRFFDKFENEIQNSILRFCLYFNKEDKIQITDYHFHV